MKVKNHNRRWAFTRAGNYTNGSQGVFPNCGTPIEIESVNIVTSQDTTTYSDNIPGWREKLRSGLEVVTSGEGFRSTYASRTGQYVYYPLAKTTSAKCIKGEASGHLSQVSMPPRPGKTMSSLADERARQALLKSFLKETAAFRGGNALAEIRETIGFLANPLKSLYTKTWTFAGRVGKLRKVWRRGNRGDYAKFLADNWLAYKFGVAPTVADINEATAAVNELAQGLRPNIRRIIGTGTDVTKFPDVVGPVVFPTGITIGFKQHTTESLSATVRYIAAIREESLSVGGHLAFFGLSGFDVLPAVWGAIPYSWIIDYFLSVQESLDALRMFSVRPDWGVRTIRNTWVRESTIIRNPQDPNLADFGSYMLGGAKSRASQTYWNRAPISVLPSPSLRFRAPPWDSMKWLNIAALRAQMRSSKP